MILDTLDFFIIKSIFEKKNTTTWEIAKAYGWENKPTDKKELSRFFVGKGVLIGKRLERMQKYNLVFISKENRTKIFTLISDNVQFKKKFKFPDRDSPAILIKDKGWIIIQY